MIVELIIRNFAIIEEVHLRFHPGLNVLTGETGAGKSILLDALELLLGARASQEMIRHGSERAEIEGLVQLNDHPSLLSLLRENGIEWEEGMIILQREIGRNGKSICRINGKLVPISLLREIGEQLIHIHGQEDHHQMMEEAHHLHWLDSYGETSLLEKRKAYQRLYRQYREIFTEYESLRRDEKETAQRIDLLTYQYKEITDAALTKNEEEKLTEERKRLIYGEKLMRQGEGAYQALTGENKTLDWLGIAMRHLEEVAEIEPILKEKFQQVEEAFFLLEEVSRDLRIYLDDLDIDEGRLATVEERLHQIQQLKRKYGDSIEAILEYAATIEKDLERLVNKESLMEKYEKELTLLRDQLRQLGRELTKIRREVAEHLSSSIHEELKELYLDQAKFRVKVEDIEEEVLPPSKFEIKGGEEGMNRVIFMVATNPGEPLKPLVKIASGGELSRIALALRTVLAKVDEVGTLVFDEIDTGVSGRISEAIGEKLFKISLERQVIAITHHPQVAAYADVHFLIQKEIEEDRAVTRVKELTEEERVLDLARMVGGYEVTSTAIHHAKELREGVRKKVKS